MKFCQVTLQIRGCRDCFGCTDSHNKPKSHMELLFGLWRMAHLFIYIWVCASKILSVRFIFPEGRISLTNVSERKDKMRLGMTLTSNPKDNSFVVRGSLTFIGSAILRYNIKVPCSRTFWANTLYIYIKIAMAKVKKRKIPTRLFFDYMVVILQLFLQKLLESMSQAFLNMLKLIMLLV